MDQARPRARSQADDRVREALGAVSDGSVLAVGDLFDLVGADVWRVAVVLCADPHLAEEITISVFRSAWQRPADVPTTYDGARRHLTERTGEVARMFAIAASGHAGARGAR